jgi:hypothetical protein
MEEKLKLDLNYKFKQIDGKELKSPEDQKPLTMKAVCIAALLGNYPEESRTLDGIEKFKRFNLAQDIQKSNGLFEVTTENITLLKELIPKNWHTLVAGQAWKIIESLRPPEPEKKIPSKKGKKK